MNHDKGTSLGAVSFAFALAILSFFGCDECDPDQIRCHNDKVQYCDEPGEGGLFGIGTGNDWETVIDCGEYGTVCRNGLGHFEADYDNDGSPGIQEIGCVVPDIDCDFGSPLECNEDEDAMLQCVLSAEGSVHVIIALAPQDKPYCVESLLGNDAVFAYLPGNCSPGEESCHEFYDAIIDCEIEFWTLYVQCPSGTECIESGNNQVECE